MASKHGGRGRAPDETVTRRPEDVAVSALANEEFLRQLEGSIEEERRRIPPIPFRQILDEETAKRRSG